VAGTTVALALFGLVALFWSTVEAAFQTWGSSATFSHCYLILPVSAYLIWRRSGVLANLSPKPSPWAFPFLAVAALFWLLGHVAGVLLVQELAFVAMIQALCLTVLGWRVVRAMAFPLFYLYFLVPFGDVLVPYLQDFTAAVLTWLLRFFGIPVFTDGTLISIPTGNFEVAEVCAGLRFLIASVAFGFLFANLVYRSWPRRVLFIAMSVTVPVLANGLRAFGIVMIAYWTDNRLAAGIDHIVYGWLFFSAVTLVLVLVGMTFREKELDADLPTAAPAPAPSAGEAASAPAIIVATSVCALLVAGSAPAYSAYIEARAPDAAQVSLLAPEVRPPWRPIATGDDRWRPRFPGHDGEILQSYAAGGRTVRLYVAYYGHQRQGAEVVNYANRFADGERWVRAGGGRAEAIIEGKPMTLLRTRMLSRGTGRVLWHWYWVGGEFTASPYVAKLLEIKAKLLRGTEAAAVIAVAADYDIAPAQAVATLHRFLESAPAIRSALESTAAD
jgi:exosortase A